jgi:hypothetical protein
MYLGMETVLEVVLTPDRLELGQVAAAWLVVCEGVVLPASPIGPRHLPLGLPGQATHAIIGLRTDHILCTS